jgi:hypothetical protein
LSQWNFQLVDLLFDSSVGLADYQCRQLLEERYHRANPVLSENIGLDEYKKMDKLLQAADRFPLDTALQWIGAHW